MVVAEEYVEINYDEVTELLSKIRTTRNIKKYAEYAKKLYDALHIPKEGNDGYSIVNLDAVLIGIFQKHYGISKDYYSKNSEKDDDKDEEGDMSNHHLYYCMLNGYGLLEGYYHHRYVSDDWVFEDFYPAKNRTFDFLQKSCYLDYDPYNKNDFQKTGEKSRDFKRVQHYCGNTKELRKYISTALQSYAKTDELNEFYRKCIRKNTTEDGKLKLPRNPYRLDVEESRATSSNNPRRSRSEPQFATQNATAQDAPLKARFNVKNRPIHFTGRNKMLADIRDEFAASGYIQILYGQAGIGKTAVAKEYAYRYQKDYYVVWWIDADSYPTITKSCRKFLSRNYIVSKEQLQDSDDDILSQFREYFRNAAFNWLLIYDNADYLNNSDDENSGRESLISSMPEDSPNGHILITSRCNVDFMAAKRSQLDVFTEEQALDYLKKRTGQDTDDAAKAVAERLGYLPLALSYAGAYIVSSDINYNDYLEILHEYGMKVLDRKLPAVTDYYDTVRVAFQITVDKLKSEMQSPEEKRISDAVLQFLNICAYIAPDNINLVLYIKTAKYLPDPLGSVLRDKLDLDMFEMELVKYSLFVKTSKQMYSVHRLLQEIIRDEHKGDGNNPTENEIKEIKKWITCSCLMFWLIKRTGEYDTITPESINNTRSLTLHYLTALRWYAPYAHSEREMEFVCGEYKMWQPISLNDEFRGAENQAGRYFSDQAYLNILNLIPLEHPRLDEKKHWCESDIAYAYYSIGEFGLAAQYLKIVIKHAVSIFEKHLYSPINFPEDLDHIVHTIYVVITAASLHFEIENPIVQPDLDCCTDKMFLVIEKVAKESDNLKNDQERLIEGIGSRIWDILPMVYELKFQSNYKSRVANKEEGIALGEAILEKENRDSMRLVISNVVNFIVDHISEPIMVNELTKQYADKLQPELPTWLQNRQEIIVDPMDEMIRSLRDSGHETA